MENSTSKVNIKAVFGIIGAVLLGVAVGAVVIYKVMAEPKINDQATQIEDLKVSLEKAETKSTEKSVKNEAPTAESVTESAKITDNYEKLQSFCKSASGTAQIYVRNRDGEYGQCGLEGAMMVAIVRDGEWVKLIEGQDIPEDHEQILKANKVPAALVRNKCQFAEGYTEICN